MNIPDGYRAVNVPGNIPSDYLDLLHEDVIVEILMGKRDCLFEVNKAAKRRGLPLITTRDPNDPLPNTHKSRRNRDHFPIGHDFGNGYKMKDPNHINGHGPDATYVGAGTADAVPEKNW